MRRAVRNGSEAKCGAAFERVNTAAPSDVECNGGVGLAFAGDGPVRLGLGELHWKHATDGRVGVFGARTGVGVVEREEDAGVTFEKTDKLATVWSVRASVPEPELLGGAERGAIILVNELAMPSMLKTPNVVATFVKGSSRVWLLTYHGRRRSRACRT